MPGIFDGEHHFQVSPTSGGSSFIQEEASTGIPVRIMGATNFERTQRGFVDMNEALKRRAEA